MKRIITLVTFLGAALFFANSQAFAADETWPLRLAGGGDEVWPLRFVGEATTVSETPRVVDTVLVLQYINGRVMLPNQARNLQCNIQGATVQKHEARGTVMIDGATHQIVGVCYDPGSDTLEVVSQRSTERAILSGPLPTDTNRIFRGRLHLAGTDREGRYNFTVRFQRTRSRGDGSIPLSQEPDRL